MTLIGRKVLQYEIRGLLGSGGMGEVYEAYDAVLDKRVAVKVLHPHLAAKADQAARFDGEAIAAVNVRVGDRLHENVVEVIGRDLIDGRPVIVLEYLYGADLEVWLQTRERGGHGPVAIDDALRIILQICYALDAAHRSGIVHRDLKPQNVFVLSNGPRRLFLKLLDFGIAKIASHLKATGVLTRGPMGTLEYMAPEQYESPKTVDARADVFAVGCILYRVLVGRMPYELEEDDEWGAQLRNRQAAGLLPPAPSTLRRDLDPRFDAIVAQCFAYDRENRFPGVQMLAERIIVAAGDDGPDVFAEVWPGGFTAGPDAGTARYIGGSIPPPRANPSVPPAAPGPSSVSGAAGVKRGTVHGRVPRWVRIGAPMAVVVALMATWLVVRAGGTGATDEAAGSNASGGRAVAADGGLGAAVPAPVVVDAGVLIVDAAPAVVTDAAAAVVGLAVDAGAAVAPDAGTARRRSPSRGKPPPRSSPPMDAGVRPPQVDGAPPRRRFDPERP